MAKVRLLADNHDYSDLVFEIELSDRSSIMTFVDLVKHGGKAAGLAKPVVRIQSNGQEQDVSHRNDWSLDLDML